MSHPLSASYYADRAVVSAAPIVANEAIARDTYRLRLRAPEIAARIVPGQFVMVRIAGADDPMLGRAFALFDLAPDESGRPRDLEIVYLVVGKMTSRLVNLTPGRNLEVWGPLGNGFSREQADHLILVGGGVGMTPFLAVAQQALGTKGFGGRAPARLAERVTFCYGARSGEYFAALNEFEKLGVELRLSTDDGSRGHHGRVTDLLRDVFSRDGPAREDSARRVLCCGPEPMMAATSELCRDHNVPCEVSLETPMACGIGICFSCVTKVRQPDGTWDYKRTCVEGPIFDAAALVWD